MGTETSGGRPRWKRWLATTSAIVYLLPATVALGSLAVLTSWLPPRGNAMCFLARLWARGLLVAAGVPVQVEQEEALEPGRGYLVMANHASYFDVVALLAVLPGQYRFVAKRSLFFIPIFGWSLWAGGFVPVDRKDKSKARDVWKGAKDRLERGASVLFYPEGTRSPDGRVHAFLRGAFLVAMQTKAPILPVGVSGAREVMPKGRWSIDPGVVRVRLGAVVETAQYGVRERVELMARVRGEVGRLAGAELA